MTTAWGEDGSKRAVNALRAALDAGKFVEYHEVLFRNQVKVESAVGFTTDTLLELADDVSGPRGEEFDQAVRTMKYKSFVEWIFGEERFKKLLTAADGVLG